MLQLTPKKLIKYVENYDYAITLEQAKELLELLDNTFGVFDSTDIQMATDYIVNGFNSRYANYFS